MKIADSFSKVATFAVSLLFLFSCSPKEDETTKYVVEGVKLDITQSELIPGDTVSLTATLLPFNTTVDEAISWDSEMKDLVFWKSSDTKVARVNDHGLVTAVGVGTCDISFICGTIAAVCKVTVRSFDKDILYGIWEVEDSDDKYSFFFEGTGYYNDSRFFDWTFDGMRLSITYKGSDMGKTDRMLVVTSIYAGKVKFYYSDDKDKHSLSLRRVPQNIVFDAASYTLTEKPVLGDSSITVVNLGLPSGTLWATCNLGAATPDKDGLRFAWAETAPKQEYKLENYSWYSSVSGEFTKYLGESEAQLQAADDPATVCLGEQWYTPSLADVTELFENCNVLYGIMSGKEGFIFLPKNEEFAENRLFIPFSLSSNIIDKADSGSPALGSYAYEKYGFFWTSTLSGVNNSEAYSFCVNLDENSAKLLYETGKSRRYFGLCIRPVYKK